MSINIKVKALCQFFKPHGYAMALLLPPNVRDVAALQFLHLEGACQRGIGQEEHGLLLICHLALTKYRHGVHNCIEEVGELAELVRSHYLKIELGAQLNAICQFYTVNLAFLPDHLRLPFLTEGAQYIAALSLVRDSSRA